MKLETQGWVFILYRWRNYCSESLSFNKHLLSIPFRAAWCTGLRCGKYSLYPHRLRWGKKLKLNSWKWYEDTGKAMYWSFQIPEKYNSVMWKAELSIETKSRRLIQKKKKKFRVCIKSSEQCIQVTYPCSTLQKTWRDLRTKFLNFV